MEDGGSTYIGKTIRGLHDGILNLPMGGPEENSSTGLTHRQWRE